MARTSAGEAAGDDSENTTNKPQVPNSDGKHAPFTLRSPDLQDSASDGVSTRNTPRSKCGLDEWSARYVPVLHVDPFKRVWGFWAG